MSEAMNLPWEDLLFHENWEVRNDANIRLAAVCASISDPKDPRFREFGPYFTKTVADPNALVQEKALDALIAYLQAAEFESDAHMFAVEVCDAVAANCMMGGSNLVEKTKLVFMLWVYLGLADLVLDVMEKAIQNTDSMVVVHAVDVIYQNLWEFGPEVVPPERTLKMLTELLEHQDQNVHECSMRLTRELCRLIGKDSVQSLLLVEMRDRAEKRLDALLGNVSGTARLEQDIEPEHEAVYESVLAFLQNLEL